MVAWTGFRGCVGKTGPFNVLETDLHLKTY
ncbi:unnamed protein product [Lathyrus sativus]|nr:unnamed protein product [Lathyrus sativus]